MGRRHSRQYRIHFPYRMGGINNMVGWIPHFHRLYRNVVRASEDGG